MISSMEMLIAGLMDSLLEILRLASMSTCIHDQGKTPYWEFQNDFSTLMPIQSALLLLEKNLFAANKDKLSLMSRMIPLAS